MEYEMLISFIIPVYNTPTNLLRRCVDCILKCKRKDIEIILVDDGSAREVRGECDALSEMDPRISVYHQDNQGVSVARNYGIVKSKGQYLVFVDPDDFINDDFWTCIEELQDSNEDIILFDYTRMDARENKIRVQISDKEEPPDVNELIRNSLFCGKKYPDYFAGAVWAKAFRRKFLFDNNLKFDSNLRKSQDRAFMVYAFCRTQSVKYKKLNSYVYYQNFESICNKYSTTARSRAYAFINAVDTFLKENSREGLDSKHIKYMLRYLQYFEILYLDYFNFQNPNKRKINRKEAKEDYIKLNIKKAVHVLNVNDFTGIIERTKFVLIKFRCFYLLEVFIKYRQKKNRKKRK